MPTAETLETITAVVKFIFSWVILLPIAVIVSGKFITQQIALQVTSTQLFKISLGALRIQSTGDEVILGFGGFIITLLLVAFVGGQEAYGFVKNSFGIDPGHFNALCVLSSFIMVAWSFLIFLLSKLGGFATDQYGASQRKEHAELIKKLGKDKK